MTASGRLLVAKIVAILVVTPAVVLATYAWIFPIWNIRSFAGLIVGVLGAMALGYYCVQRKIGVMAAIFSAVLVGSAVFCTCLFLMLNIFGA
jgi:hypothetical protein